MRSTVAIIGVAAAGIIGLTVGAVTSPGGIALASPGNSNAIEAPAPDAAPSGPDGMRGPGGPDRPGPGWMHRQGFKLKLARDLAGLETLIGIRADQLDAWRDYTSALLAVIGPPLPHPRAADTPADGRGPEAFGRAEHLADATIARGEEAEKLKAAIETLRQKLTPEQLALLQQAERRMGPHPHPFPPGPGPQDQRSEPSPERPAPDAG
jgi:hypothetical protein